MSVWYSGRVSVSYGGCPRFQSCNLPFNFDFSLSLNSANSLKTLGDKNGKTPLAGRLLRQGW